jgi:hypothetical protein
MTTRFVPRWVLESDDPRDQDPILTVQEVQTARYLGQNERLTRAKVLLIRPDTGQIVPVSAVTMDMKLQAGWLEPVRPPMPEVEEYEDVVEEEVPVKPSYWGRAFAADFVVALLIALFASAWCR